MKKIYPAKLKKGDTVQIVAPAISMATFSKARKKIIDKKMAELGLKVIFGKHVKEKDEFNSSGIKARVDDFHDAFLNPEVKAVIAVTGGFNCNQLLRYLKWDIIRSNPKVFCGYSDITALNNAIFAKTGLISYSGPVYSTFGRRSYFDYTFEYFKSCLFSEKPFGVFPSEKWSDDHWWVVPKKLKSFKNPGWLVINKGEAQGTILGGNLNTFNLLRGSEYFPNIGNSILFLEDDYLSGPELFDRDLQALIHHPQFKRVNGMVIGRFEIASKMSNEKLIKIIKTKKELDRLPVIANVDFGHTDPKITFPVGGTAKMKLKAKNSKLEIIYH